jgi:hypothetical protein
MTRRTRKHTKTPTNHHTFVPINSPCLITGDYNNTADYVLVILDHSHAFRVTVPDAVHTQFDLLKMSIIMLETCRGLQYYMNKDICALSW